MKKFIFATLMTFIMVGFVSCSKDKLEGTTWKATITETEDDFTFSMDLTIAFTSDKEGTMTMSAMGYTESEKFTYTFDGEKGVMTGVTPDEDTGELISTEFTVDGDELTITEEGQTVVFKKQ
ncbi:MAG: hypothetical protein J6X58_02225 [Bacteroidales bacterium]|nr:hypothetical protein [Bacteroidales bacterium]